jgi:hypothetical protein
MKEAGGSMSTDGSILSNMPILSSEEKKLLQQARHEIYTKYGVSPQNQP